MPAPEPRTARPERRAAVLLVVVAGLGLAGSILVALDGAPGHDLGRERVADGGVALLVAGWLAVVHLAATRRVGNVVVCGLAAAWGLPLLLAAPVLSFDAYSYLADGRLLATGHDPYHVGPAALGPHDRWATRVDPQFLHLHAPYGSLALLIGRVGAGIGGPAAGLAFLTAVSALAVVVVAVVVWRLAPPDRRPLALALWPASPLVLLHLVGGLHIDAVMAALVALSLLAARRDRWLVAAALLGLATAIKPPAGIGLLALVLIRLPPGRRPAWSAIVRRGAAGALAYLVPALVVGDPRGLVSTVANPTSDHTLAAPSVLVGHVLGGSAVGYDVTGAIGVLVAATVIAWLVVTARRRPVGVTVGGSLLAVVLGAPVLYPWYLTWSLPGLAPTGRRWLVPLLTAGTLVYVPGLSGLSALGVLAVVAVTTGLLLAAVAVGWPRRSPVGRRPRPSPQP